MALLIEVTVQVRSPLDNSIQVGAHRQTVTINPQQGDPDAEAALAQRAVATLAAECAENVQQDLDDWANAVKVIHGSSNG